MSKVNTSARLKQLMKERNLKQVDILNLSLPLCSKYNVKMNKSDISQYVSGKVEPSQEKLVILGMALNVTEAWLMGFDVPQERKNVLSKTALINTINKNAPKHGIIINVLGKVAAGIPLEAIEDIVDTEEISEDMAKTGTFFGLVINGDSMEPKISKGDVVIVRQQEDAETGDIVIATVNGDDATCKRLKKYKDGIALLSTNPIYEPIYFSNEEIQNKPVKIIGKVVELRAKF